MCRAINCSKRTKKQIPSAITLKKLRFAKLNCIIAETETSSQELEGQNKSHSNVTLKMFLLIEKWSI